MEQISWNDYIEDENKKYAKICRHAMGDYCYLKHERLDKGFICPCEEYEEKLLCDGCKHQRGGLNYCLTEPTCKRYSFSPAVSTKNDPDKWEARE